MKPNIAVELKRVASSTRTSLKVLSSRTRIDPARLSEYQNGRRIPPFHSLEALADGYGIDYRTIVRLWMTDKLRSQDSRDRLIDEVFSEAESPSDSVHDSLLGPLSSNHDVYRAAMRVLSHVSDGKELLDRSAQEILRALSKIPTIDILGGNRSASSVTRDAASNGSRVWEKSEIRKYTLFVAKRPSPLLAEIHHIPPLIGGLHRQANLRSRPSGYELWAVLKSDTAVLLTEHDGDWIQHNASTGSSGFYPSNDTHIWCNLSPESPLVIFHVFFPYRPTNFSSQSTDESAELKLDGDLKCLPERARDILRAITSNC